MFLIAYGQQAYLRAPELIYCLVYKEGILGDSVPIIMPHYSMMHDFAITENYAIFIDLPIGLDLYVHNLYFHNILNTNLIALHNSFSEATVIVYL